ncbi:S-methyl-5-thioribose-1-phosphate isomerase [Pseudomethylobacillus aquaticus]|uniref:Methylthioribose-1-phosphate isomerase n=1 Tax=Pseudomethylobacillus aquaticus TaxID=2676064 RepID=A0A3N0V5W5_9PROT|nr:S-methyl-5-thioribose-1-phosphate isomerase [Pseudomethylobacillus aquaticus]ROH88200.1 S-methyl-5-thioribose-1-phosphate isomerase [Pseudomethylobacillus aquaticus]
MNIKQQSFRTIWPVADGQAVDIQAVEVIDQTSLPHEFRIVRITTLQAMIHAIRTMQVRGAPLIGASAAYGMALASKASAEDAALAAAAQALLASRPTAVNLRWAVQRMLQHLLALPVQERRDAAWQEAAVICDEDVALNKAIAAHGLGLLRAIAVTRQSAGVLNILTHCNAGWLATVDWGTALAPVYAAHEAGMQVHVWVDETRPRNQGASLTAWELGQHGVPHTVITDNAGGHLMQHGQVDVVIVGADRVSGAGDVCNKIGTYLKALAAHDNQVPFYVAVPSPTIDWQIVDAQRDITIEERDADEVGFMQGRLDNGELARVSLLPEGSAVANPAFDVTPARLVTGIITERGVCSPAQLVALFEQPVNG